MNHILNEEERRRFVIYCRAEANSYQMMAEQMEKLPHGEAMVKRQKLYEAAYTIVADHIDAAEEVVLGK